MCQPWFQKLLRNAGFHENQKKQVWFGFIEPLVYQKIEPTYSSKICFHSIFPVNQTIFGEIENRYYSGFLTLVSTTYSSSNL
jgi:hypothetical protein